jgi:hypothetical protein
MDSVDGAVSIIGTKGILVCPPIAYVDQFSDEGAMSLVKDTAKNITPLVREHRQEKLSVAWISTITPADDFNPTIAILCFALPFHKRSQSDAQKPQGLSDTLIVAGRHVLQQLLLESLQRR